MRSPRTTTTIAALLVGAAAVTTLAGCSMQPQTVDLSKACASIAKVDGKLACTAAYTTGKALRLPTSGAVVGAVGRDGKAFLSADGKKLSMNSAVSKQISEKNAYATTVYEADVVGSTVTGVRAVLSIPNSVILSSVFGGKILAGTISPYRGSGLGYDEHDTLPVAIQFEKHTDGDTLTGTIVNANHATRFANGTCMPALSTYGAENPLRGGFTPHVSIDRQPSMHAAFDDELELAWASSSSGMGHEFFPSVATLMGADPIGAVWEVTQHGTPSAGPGLDLKVTTDALTQAASCA
ncbi:MULTISPECIES: hypothetical protein [unclassified Curtobacterium]|jgi:hypothetical protein|uniref:hypothetical protein n=1 Tax=unclassified Curtobacterium TaxID=257496 RepID=UPI00285CBA82|nr:hypothetical protein [Curtobacterium sp. 320]MDR6573564.1 membrane-associated protease RseP (regulator of RpoE activity) [Curtobacterium sp. 320]